MTRIIYAFILSGISLVATAQDSTRVISLEEVVLTANKYPKKQTETGKVLTVINHEQLERSYGKTLGEVLNTSTGTTIVGSNSNMGTNQTVSIRGGSAGNVLILVNGVPANDPSVNDNYIDLNFFSIEQVDRIEILKGGQSTLYGSDAVAGVINIITKKSVANQSLANLSVAAGSYGTLRTNLGLNKYFTKSSLSLNYGYNHSNGFSSANDSSGIKGFDKDGFNQHNLSGSWQVNLSDQLQANIFGLFSRYKTDIDASGYTDEKDFTVTTNNLQSGAGLSYKINNGNIQFNYRYNRVGRVYLDDSLDHAPNYVRADYDGVTNFAELYGNRRWKHIEVLAGIDYRRNTMNEDLIAVSSFGPFTAKIKDSVGKMSQISPYASVILKANKVFNIEVGGRWNSHSEYGNNFTYTINPNVFVNNKVKVFANIYSAFKAPTLYQLFEPSFGNTELKPEKSVNFESGAQWFVTNDFNARAVYFYRSTDKAIELIYTDIDNFISKYANISNKKAKGLELEMEYQGEKWNASANFTHTKGSLTSAYDNTGFPVAKDTVINNLFRIPENVFNGTAGLRVSKKFYVSTTLRVAGKRLEPIYGGAPKELAAYYTVNLYGEYKLSNHLRFFADFKNITDQKYFEIMGYNTRRFNFMGGVQIAL